MDESIQILLVDDNELDRVNIQRGFKHLKIKNTIIIAEHGLQALDILRRDDSELIAAEPYIILLDLNMPKMNGIEFLHEIRNDTALKNAVVYVLTTSESPNDIDEVRQYNVSGYIVKPLERVELLKALSILDAYWSINQILN